jgi:hypothetical protein
MSSLMMNPFMLNGYGSGVMNPMMMGGYGMGGMGSGIMDPLMASGYGMGGYGMGGYGMGGYGMGGYGMGGYGMGGYGMGGYGMGGYGMGGYGIGGYGMGGLYSGLWGGMFGYGNRFTANLFSRDGWVNPVPLTPTPPIQPDPADEPYHDSCLNGLWGSLHEKLPFVPPPKGWRNRMLPEAPGYYTSNYWA